MRFPPSATAPIGFIETAEGSRAWRRREGKEGIAVARDSTRDSMMEVRDGEREM